MASFPGDSLVNITLITTYELWDLVDYHRGIILVMYWKFFAHFVMCLPFGKWKLEVCQLVPQCNAVNETHWHSIHLCYTCLPDISIQEEGEYNGQYAWVQHACNGTSKLSKTDRVEIVNLMPVVAIAHGNPHLLKPFHTWEKWASGTPNDTQSNSSVNYKTLHIVVTPFLGVFVFVVQLFPCNIYNRGLTIVINTDNLGSFCFRNCALTRKAIQWKKQRKDKEQGHKNNTSWSVQFSNNNSSTLCNNHSPIIVRHVKTEQTPVCWVGTMADIQLSPAILTVNYHANLGW